MQGDTPCLWAKVNTNEPMIFRKLRMAGTGHVLDKNYPYVGTFQISGSGLVFHVFDIGEEMKRG
jgi:hypothetical protein